MKINYRPTKSEIRKLAKDYNATSIIFTADGFELVGVAESKKAEIKGKL